MKVHHRSLFSATLDGLISVSYLVVCKLLFRDYGFPYATLLTSVHFFVLSVVLWTGLALRFIRFQRLSLPAMLSWTVVFGGAVTLENLSLQTNSLVFHLLVKVSMPLVLSMQEGFVNADITGRRVWIGFVMITIGVLVAMQTDLELTFLGTLLALSTGFLRWVHEQAMETHVSGKSLGTGPQLLLYQAPIATVVLLPIAVVSDNLSDNYYLPCADTIFFVLVSALLAVVMCLSPFLLLSTMSDRSLVVLGHVKLLIGLAIGVTLFDNPASEAHYGGTAMAYLGAVLLPLPE